MSTSYLSSVIERFNYYKDLGERAMIQLPDDALFKSPDKESNSIAVMVKHLWGNMRSRWTDFLNSDGEKSWRNRDSEFEDDINGRAELMQKWEEGWSVLLASLNALEQDQFETTVLIRDEEHTVIEAINRQLAHYAYHIGQIVYLARMLKGESWQSLSIPKGGSKDFNKKMFKKP